MARCKFCRSETPECFECERCLSEGLNGPHRTIYVCRACVEQEEGVKCECERKIPLEHVATPAEHLVRYFDREGIKDSFGDIGKERIECAAFVVITREGGFWWYRLYCSEHAGRTQLQRSTGVLFQLDAAEGRLAGEVYSSESESWCSVSWWTRPWAAWALNMIRFKTGLVNLMSLCPTHGRLGRDLMKQGIIPGTEGNPCPLSLAQVVLVTKEGPWYYFYPFPSLRRGKEVMDKWSSTVSILFRLDRREPDATRLTGEIRRNTPPPLELLWQKSIDSIRSKIDGL